MAQVQAELPEEEASQKHEINIDDDDLDQVDMTTALSPNAENDRENNRFSISRRLNRSLTIMGPIPRSWKLGAFIIGCLCIVGAVVGIVVASDSQVATQHNGVQTSRDQGPATPTETGFRDMPTDDPETSDEEHEFFLKIEAQPNGNSIFVLNKQHWNKSFVVYPSVDKHSTPVGAGRERGSGLLDTSEHVFHFEMSHDSRFLRIVRDNYLTRLDGENNELKEAYQNNQWPGYIIQLPIFMETETAYYFPSGPLLSSGFFVSLSLMSSHFTVLPEQCSFFPQNANIMVEYEVSDGVLRALYSIALLPEQEMPKRIADDRIGYFSLRYMVYGSQEAKQPNGDGFRWMKRSATIIARRRLERDPLTRKTRNPIIYYIDTSVPARWRASFARGVEAWSDAFEAIGFKDAIKAVLPGSADWPKDFRVGDLRYNSISVILSDRTYALGPSVIDPRSGEILHSDILFEYGFFDEVVSDFDIWSPSAASGRRRSLRSDAGHTHPTKSRSGQYRQCNYAHHEHHELDRALLSLASSSDSQQISDELIGKHFSDIIMHEVGHTLGLRHNFAGSAAVQRSDLSNDQFASKHGLSASIMDYLPVNVFSNLTRSQATHHEYYMERLGSYDYAAIAYGYTSLPNEVPGQKSPALTQLAQRAPLFLTDEDAEARTNPYAQRFDLSSDPIDYANDRLDLVHQLRQSNAQKLPNDASWTALWTREYVLLRLINSTTEMVRPFLGGVNVTHAHRAAGSSQYKPEFVSKAVQLRALNVLGRIIRADAGIFPAPEEYSTYIRPVGFEDEDCMSPNLDYGCLGRSLVDIDHEIMVIRQHAVVAALFPCLSRIASQDIDSPLSFEDVLSALYNAASHGGDVPRNKAVFAYFYALMRYIGREHDDFRVRLAVSEFIAMKFQD